MRAAQGCFGAAQSFKNKAEKDNLRIYGLEGALVEEGEVFTRNRESSYRRTGRIGGVTFPAVCEPRSLSAPRRNCGLT